jgi:hypothetical protein
MLYCKKFAHSHTFKDQGDISKLPARRTHDEFNLEQ